MAGRNDKPDAFGKALGMLARREYSRRDLGRKLGARGIDPDETGAALDRLAEHGFQNDDRFAGAFARSRAGAGYGPVRIRAELLGHGLSAEQIDAALDTCENDWDADARTLIVRRYAGKNLADPALRRKAIDFLLRRGFAQSAAYAAVRALPFDDDR
ncbi:MAG: regulatory protein RecX [Xanthomonadaceae bacterium]|nr:regulatory protein RecX [Xanthomonadaceae bacterium]